jgi:hypothetical protein
MFDTHPVLFLRERWPDALRFKLVLAVLLAILCVSFPVQPQGDVAEYSLATVAVASHGSPDIRLTDIARARQLLPGIAGTYDLLEADMRAGVPVVYPAFIRGRAGAVYTIHFFGYSALAAVPYKLLELAGLPPMKCYQVLNLALVFILGLGLYRLFGSAPKALLGVGLFMLCGGALYWSWTSAECVSAAALLAALLFFTTGAPLAGGLLAGLAAQQNPTILFFFAFAPLILLCLHYRPGQDLREVVGAALQRRYVAGMLAGLVLVALPPLFNLWQYGVPNIIAKLYSNPALIGVARLESFYFDLNQGMIVGIPGVLGALAVWNWRRQPALLAACAAFTLALALPALAVLNWNSGAAGVMRYAFWASMPFVFALLLRLQASPRWPLALLLALGVAQGGAMQSATHYGYVHFSPLARTLMELAPGFYHPEPEIFAERLNHNDDYITPHQVFVYRVGGQAVTTLYHAALPFGETQLCGEGGKLAPDNHYTDSAYGWRYIDGPVRCVAGGGQVVFTADQFRNGAAIALASGWSGVEDDGKGWRGAWSEGARSRLAITLDGAAAPASVTIAGTYLEGNTLTRVRINGSDLGWLALDRPQPLALPPGASQAKLLQIELEHQAPHAPGHGSPDTRALAFFLSTVTLR